MVRSVSFGGLFAEVNDLVSRQAGFLIAATAAIAALFVGLDALSILSGDANGMVTANLLVGFAITLLGQYLVVERLLADRLPAGQVRAIRRYGVLFGALFFSGLAIVAGLIVLLVPGLYLAGRWLTIAQRVVEGHSPAMDELRASWNDSEPSQLVFTIAYVIGMAPTFLIIASTFFPELLAIPDDVWLTSFFVNGLSAVTSIAGWVISTAAYRQAVPVDSQIQSVFV